MPFCISCDARIDYQRTSEGKIISVNPELISYDEAATGEDLITLEGRHVRVEADLSLSVKGRIPHSHTCQGRRF